MDKYYTRPYCSVLTNLAPSVHRSMDSISKVFRYSQTNRHVQESLDIIERAFVKYGIERTCLSFNGGKDCTAVVHMVHSIARKLCPNNNEFKLVAFYAQLPNHFKEEANFVEKTAERYNLTLRKYSSKSLKDSLYRLKSDEPQLEAIFIGTRRDDFKPGTIMTPMQPTDDNWPKFMRINPILDWSYAQVWSFIRETEVPYCDLYNQGYSSLGTRDNTMKNSSLLRFDQDGQPYYLPAWHLTSSKEERLSRSSSQDTTNKGVHGE